MPAAAPQSKVQEILGRLSQLEGDDGEELAHLTWQLRSLVQKQLSNFDARIALSQALLL